MMKRVLFNRPTVWCFVLASAICICTPDLPAMAREYILAGQAGDPGDGFGVQEIGGSSTDLESGIGTARTANSPIGHVVLLPVYGVSGLLVFQVVFIISSVYFRKLQ